MRMVKHKTDQVFRLGDNVDIDANCKRIGGQR